MPDKFPGAAGIQGTPDPASGAPAAAVVWHPLHLPWQDQTTAPPDRPVPEVRWWLENGALVWEVRAPLPLAARGTFKTAADGVTEGLWTQDVAECFLADAATGHYTEYNLSPGGAWWACRYSGPRVRISPQPDWPASGIFAGTEWTETHWRGRMICPLPVTVAEDSAAADPVDGVGGIEGARDLIPAESSFPAETGGFTVNFTAVVATETMREYHSLARIGGGDRPNFHRLMNWLPLAGD